MTNPYFLPCTIDGAERPPLVEVWPACRPKITSSDPHVYGLHHRRVEGWCLYNEERAEFYEGVTDYQALALTFRAVLKACGEQVSMLDGAFEILHTRVRIANAALANNDAALNELAHRLHMETTR